MQHIHDYKALFRDKVTIHFASLYEYICFWGLPKEVRDNIAQEAIEIAWDKIEQLKDPDKAQPWLLDIARDLIRAHYRQADGEGFYRMETSESIPTASEKLNAEVLQILEKAESEAIIHKILNRMDEDCRRTVILYYYLGYSCAEISEIMNQDYDTVKMNRMKALEQMRTLYAEYADGREE